MGTFSPAIDAKLMPMASSPGLTDLYQRYSDAVFYTALRVTGNSADAEDVLQTVFLRMLSPGNRMDPHAIPEAYFRRAATNVSLDILRRKTVRPEAQLDETLPHAAPQAPALLKEQLRRALAALPPHDAEMFILRYVEGLSNGDLGEMFGIGPKNVAVKLHRIRHALQEELER